MSFIRRHSKFRCASAACLVVVLCLFIWRGVLSYRRARFDRRQHELDTGCLSVNISTISPPKVLLYSRKLNLLYCPVEFTGSLSLKYAMLMAEGKTLRSGAMYHLSPEQGIHSDAASLNLNRQMLSHVETLNSKKNVRIALLVRDPWQRLLSAYHHVVIKQPQFYKGVCSSYYNDSDQRLTLESFLQCIIWHNGSKGGLWQMDRRLVPITHTCSVCKVQYNTIGECMTPVWT